MGMDLFVDYDDNDDISKIEVDKEFARRYHHNKTREDLHKLHELKKKGIVDDDSGDSDSESDDDDDLEPDDNDDMFFKGLLKVKEQDPVIKEEGAKLFPNNSSDEEEEEGENYAGRDLKEKKKKGKPMPMYIKDVHAKNLIEDGADYDQDGDERVGVKSYVDEQEGLRRAFHDEAKKVDDEDGPLFMEKASNDDDDDDDTDGDNDETTQKPLVQYFGSDKELDDNTRYLKNFFLNKMWFDKDKGKKVLEEDLEKVSEEEEEVDRQEDYEREYNFRYQENVGDRVLGHTRNVIDSVRKKPNSRKVQRQSKAERMAIAESERKEELKHLKNLKKKEYFDKVKKVKDVAGISDETGFVLEEEDSEEEFDPEKHDRKMQQIFNDDYYNSLDAKPGFCSDDEEEDEDLKKPDFTKEDILLRLPQGWDKEEDVDEEQEMAHEDSVQGKKKRKRKPSHLEKLALDDELEEKQKKELKEELYKLDYEDMIGDLKTRFPYRKVKPKRYGLNGIEILMMDDGELNQYVSLKKIAPYVENEYKVPRIKRYEQKMKNKELLEGGKVHKKMHKGKSFKDQVQTSFSGKDGLEKEEENVQGEKSNGDEDNVSRQSKRRRQQQELKLSNSRKTAYGTVDAPKSKCKSKHRT